MSNKTVKELAEEILEQSNSGDDWAYLTKKKN